MSDGLPTDRQLAALEQRVLTRIRRRAAIRGRILSGAAAVALVAGGVVLVHPILGTSSGADSSSGGAGGSAAGAPSSSVAVRCHATSDADSTVRTVPLPARPTAASVAAACDEKATASGSAPGPSGFPAHVACRSAKGVWEVFPDDGNPSTLCERNGLTAG